MDVAVGCCDARVRAEWMVVAVECFDEYAFDDLLVVVDGVLREVERFKIVGAVVVEEE